MISDTVLPPRNQFLIRAGGGESPLPEPNIDNLDKHASAAFVSEEITAAIPASKMYSDGFASIQKGLFEWPNDQAYSPEACQFERSSVREASCPIIGRWILTQSDCSSKNFTIR